MEKTGLKGAIGRTMFGKKMKGKKKKPTKKPAVNSGDYEDEA